MKKSTIYIAEENYTPRYFLAALGAGGLSVTFFMYLMFWVPHPNHPVPIYEDIITHFSQSDIITQIMISVAYLGIAAMTLLHFRLLFWNLRHYPRFKKSQAYAKLKKTNAETMLMAIPATLAMSVNASFIACLIFIPKLWNIIEYLLPVALIVFSIIAISAYTIMGRFLGRVLTQGGFSMKGNNNFSQLLPAFAFALISVGAAAPAAMSHVPWVVGLSLSLSTLFIATSTIITFMALSLAFMSVLQNGADNETAPTFMVIIPILTVLSIAFIRQGHGLHVTLGAEQVSSDTFMTLTFSLSLQVLFAMTGLLVLFKQNYFRTYLSSLGTRSAGSYVLVCPGIALAVMIHFWVNKGLVGTGLIAKFSNVYWSVTTAALIIQFAMIALVWVLHRQHFARTHIKQLAQAAE